MAVKKKKLSDMLQDLDIDLDEQTLKIISILERNKIVPENKIAEKLGLKINAARKLLYKLNIKNLAVYIKKRDPKKKWWYLYYWSLDQDKIKELFAEHKRKLLIKKREQLIAEARFAFECKACDEKFTYEDALESDFSCPNCGGLLEEVKTNKAMRRLRREIEELEVEIAKLPAKPVYKEPIPEKPKRKKKKIAKKVKKKPKKLAKKIKKKKLRKAKKKIKRKTRKKKLRKAKRKTKKKIKKKSKKKLKKKRR